MGIDRMLGNFQGNLDAHSIGGDGIALRIGDDAPVEPVAVHIRAACCETEGIRISAGSPGVYVGDGNILVIVVIDKLPLIGIRFAAAGDGHGKLHPTAEGGSHSDRLPGNSQNIRFNIHGIGDQGSAGCVGNDTAVAVFVIKLTAVSDREGQGTLRFTAHILPAASVIGLLPLVGVGLGAAFCLHSETDRIAHSSLDIYRLLRNGKGLCDPGRFRGDGVTVGIGDDALVLIMVVKIRFADHHTQGLAVVTAGPAAVGLGEILVKGQIVVGVLPLIAVGLLAAGSFHAEEDHAANIGFLDLGLGDDRQGIRLNFLQHPQRNGIGAGGIAVLVGNIAVDIPAVPLSVHGNRVGIADEGSGLAVLALTGILVVPFVLQIISDSREGNRGLFTLSNLDAFGLLGDLHFGAHAQCHGIGGNSLTVLIGDLTVHPASVPVSGHGNSVGIAAESGSVLEVVGAGVLQEFMLSLCLLSLTRLLLRRYLTSQAVASTKIFPVAFPKEWVQRLRRMMLRFFLSLILLQRQAIFLNVICSTHLRWVLV